MFINIKKCGGIYCSKASAPCSRPLPTSLWAKLPLPAHAPYPHPCGQSFRSSITAPALFYLRASCPNAHAPRQLLLHCSTYGRPALITHIPVGKASAPCSRPLPTSLWAKKSQPSMVGLNGFNAMKKTTNYYRNFPHLSKSSISNRANL